MIYRGVRAEVRRMTPDRPWQLAGVVIEGVWHPAAPGIAQATPGLIRASMVDIVALPAFVAPDDQTAARVAIDTARMMGHEPPTDRRWFPQAAPSYRIDMPDLTDEITALMGGDSDRGPGGPQ
jgi:hypothetical protein